MPRDSLQSILTILSLVKIFQIQIFLISEQLGFESISIGYQSTLIFMVLGVPHPSGDSTIKTDDEKLWIDMDL